MQRQLSSPANDDHLDALPQHPLQPHHPATLHPHAQMHLTTMRPAPELTGTDGSVNCFVMLFFTLLWLFYFFYFAVAAQCCPAGRVCFGITSESGNPPQQRPFVPRSDRLQKVKVCVGGLSQVGLAYNSGRARRLKAAQRYDGQAKRSPALCCI